MVSLVMRSSGMVLGTGGHGSRWPCAYTRTSTVFGELIALGQKTPIRIGSVLDVNVQRRPPRNVTTGDRDDGVTSVSISSASASAAAVAFTHG